MSDASITPEFPDRKHPAHWPTADRSNRTIIVFLTICTKDRRPLLATAEKHRLLLEAWRSADRWIVGRYIIMPDHLHLFCAPGSYPPTPLASWIRFWKTFVSKASERTGGSLWQRDYWDTQLRRSESYAMRWEYVRDNPVRAGLDVSSEQWPYQGVVRELRWHA